MLRKNHADVDCVCLAGLDGIMIKHYLINALSRQTNIEHCCIGVFSGTSAIKCGVSSSLLYCIISLGLPHRMTELVQILCRLYRDNQRKMQDRFVIYMCLRRFQTILLLILHCDNTPELTRQEIELRTVIKFLFFPKICYHSALSNYYSHLLFSDKSLRNN